MTTSKPSTRRRGPLFELLALELRDAGAEHTFGLMGEDTAKLATRLSELPGMTYCGARHEGMAVAMADGYARFSGRLGVALLSRGPGLTNGLTAAVAARKAGTRLLVIAGDTPDAKGRSHPKHIDQREVLRACGLETVEVSDAASAGQDVRRAIELALSGRALGLNIRTNLLDVTIDRAEATPAADGTTGSAERSLEEVLPEDVERVGSLIAASDRPLILAGHGAVESGARDDLIRLSERIGALLGTSLMGKDLFHNLPYNIGLVGGFATDAARDRIGAADLILAFGASLNAFTTAGGNLWPNARVVQVDIEPGQLGRLSPVDVGVVADARSFARALHEGAPAGVRFRSTDAEEPHGRTPERERWTQVGTSTGVMDPRALMLGLDAALPPNRAVVVDPGGASGFSSTLVSVPDPRRFLYCADFGAIGLSHGTALGGACADPSVTTALFIGDGALLLTLGELETARRCQIPLVIVVLDDGAYGAERHYLDLQDFPHHEAVYDRVPFAEIARSLGVDALTIGAQEDLRPVPDALDRRSGPLLLDCKINGAIRAKWVDELFTAKGFGR